MKENIPESSFSTCYEVHDAKTDKTATYQILHAYYTVAETGELIFIQSRVPYKTPY